MKGNLDRLSHWLKENKITEVECLISDLSGIARGKISPTNKFLNEQGMRLPESVLLQTVTGDYVEDDIYYELLRCGSSSSISPIPKPSTLTSS